MAQVKSKSADVYENINDYNLQISRWCLKLIGAWPFPKSTLEKTIAFIQIVIYSTITAIITVPCILYVLLEDVSFQMKVNIMGSLIHRIMGSASYWMLLNRSKDIRNFIQYMEADWRFVQRPEEREVMWQYMKFGRLIASINTMITQGGQVLFITAKTLRTVEIIVNNQTFTTHSMSCPIYSKIIDVRFSPINEVMIALQFVTAIMVCSAIVSVSNLVTVFAMHACGQLKVLYMWLNDFVEEFEKNNHSIDKKLAIIVERHLKILSFIARMENIMYKVCLVLVGDCTLNMCLLGYFLIMNWNKIDIVMIMSYILLYIMVSYNIFIFCYIGEMLTEQCKNVGEMIYMTNWYQLPQKTVVCLIFIIMRSNNVIKITAGKIIHFSIATFGDIFKTSIAYLNILRTITT